MGSLSYQHAMRSVRQAGYDVLISDIKLRTQATNELILDDYCARLHEAVSETHEKPFVLMGYSLGGALAAAYAKRYPEEVACLLLGDPAGMQGQESARAIARRIIGMWVKSFVQPKSSLAALRMLADGLKHVLFYPDHTRTSTRIATQVSLVGLVQQLSCPISIVWAENDEIFSKHLALELKKVVPASTLHLVKGRHDWIHQTSSQLIPILADIHADY